jgi:HlyD family secretion protein
MKRIIPVVLLLAALGGAYWWASRPAAAASAPAALAGSGTIEAETVDITAERGGRVLALKAAEGDEVRQGQVLVELDKSDLLARRDQLDAALATARSNLALASAPARPEDVAEAQAQLAQAEAALSGAKLAWQQAQDVVKDPGELDTRIAQAQAQVTEAERQVELAQVNQKRVEIKAEADSHNQRNHAALVQNKADQRQLQAARTGVQMAQLALTGARQQVRDLVSFRDKPLPLIAQADAAEGAYRQAEAGVLAAQARLAAVQAGPRPEDVAIARTRVQEAEAALAAANVQLDQQTLVAPRNGLVSRKLLDPGELAAPGAQLLELADLDAVHLTVYIPENQIGLVKIGQRARVHVDAYPGQDFEGVVSFIAQQAEFTPQNVQAQEEQASLTFAVKIKLNNPDHRLKPGMPADADILLASQPAPVSEPSPTAEPPATVTPTATPAPVSAAGTPAAAPTPTATPTPASLQAEIIAGGLSVRSGPGIDDPVIATLVKGNSVPVLEVDPEAGWLHVQLPGGEKTGWISGKPAYVSTK